MKCFFATLRLAVRVMADGTQGCFSRVGRTTLDPGGNTIMKITIIIAALSITLLFQMTFADTCPSVKDIKGQSINGWKVYDSDDGTPLSSAREKEYKKTVEEFALAEWANQQNRKGTMHCYYRDATGSSLEAYLAKDDFIPQNHKNYWYKVSGFMHCAAGMDKCRFDHRVLNNQKQLAKR